VELDHACLVLDPEPLELGLPLLLLGRQLVDLSASELELAGEVAVDLRAGLLGGLRRLGSGRRR
jgi:hypothetical protein